MTDSDTVTYKDTTVSLQALLRLACPRTDAGWQLLSEAMEGRFSAADCRHRALNVLKWSAPPVQVDRPSKFDPEQILHLTREPGQPGTIRFEERRERLQSAWHAVVQQARLEQQQDAKEQVAGPEEEQREVVSGLKLVGQVDTWSTNCLT